MTKRNLFCSAVLCAVLVPGSLMFGQGPAQDISAQRHPNLAAAQTSIAHAYQRIDQAQHGNNDQLGDHAQKAKDLLTQASQELKMAAEYANQHHK